MSEATPLTEKPWDYEEEYTPPYVYVVAVLCPLVLPFFYKYHVQVDSKQLCVGYSYYFHEEIDLCSIKKVEVMDHINGLTQFGGWGYRLTLRGESGYIARNGPGLRVAFENNNNSRERTIVFNCQDPEAVRKLIQKN